MNTTFPLRILLAALLPALILLSGCSPVQTTPKLTSSAEEADDTPFQWTLLPEQLNGHSIPGQQCPFLVSITDVGKKSPAAVVISATASGAKVKINHPLILDGQVAEVVITPEATSAGISVELTVTATRGSVSKQKTITFEVIEGEDDRQAYASQLQTLFIEWLAAKHPELGITSATQWTGTMVSPQWLVVSHYLFFSDEWEMHIEWHIMIAPDDWARIDLRRRYTELKPSLAFEISSVTAQSEPVPIVAPDAIWR